MPMAGRIGGQTRSCPRPKIKLVVSAIQSTKSQILSWILAVAFYCKTGSNLPIAAESQHICKRARTCNPAAKTQALVYTCTAMNSFPPKLVRVQKAFFIIRAHAKVWTHYSS